MGSGLFVFLVLTATLYSEDGWRIPIGEDGRPCPFPFDPLFLKGQPLGQYHCPWCGSMILAGWPHLDYREWADEMEDA